MIMMHAVGTLEPAASICCRLSADQHQALRESLLLAPVPDSPYAEALHLILFKQIDGHR